MKIYTPKEIKPHEKKSRIILKILPMTLTRGLNMQQEIHLANSAKCCPEYLQEFHYTNKQHNCQQIYTRPKQVTATKSMHYKSGMDIASIAQLEIL